MLELQFTVITNKDFNPPFPIQSIIVLAFDKWALFSSRFVFHHPHVWIFPLMSAVHVLWYPYQWATDVTRLRLFMAPSIFIRGRLYLSTVQSSQRESERWLVLATRVSHSVCPLPVNNPEITRRDDALMILLMKSLDCSIQLQTGRSQLVHGVMALASKHSESMRSEVLPYDHEIWGEYSGSC